MKTSDDTLSILLEEEEVHPLYSEILKLLGGMVTIKTAEEFPLLTALRSALRTHMETDDEKETR